MTDIVHQAQVLDPRIVHSIVIDADLSKLTPAQRVEYYVHRCRLLGIDPGERPFDLIKLNNKLTLYATKTCANALTRLNRLSIEIRSIRFEDSLVIVEARASDSEGRFADDVGVVDIDAEKIGKANAIMKAITKAKRRAVLALVGLGVLDDSEVDSVRGAHRVTLDLASGDVADDAIDAEVVDELRDSALRDLDVAVGAYADMCGGSKLAVFKKAMERMRSEAATPADLSTSAVRVATAMVIERIRSMCVTDYADLCKLAPDDFAPADQARELAAMVGLDAWPEHPTVEQYVAAMDRMAVITSRITAGDDGDDPTGEAAP